MKSATDAHRRKLRAVRIKLIRAQNELTRAQAELALAQVAMNEAIMEVLWDCDVAVLEPYRWAIDEESGEITEVPRPVGPAGGRSLSGQ